MSQKQWATGDQVLATDLNQNFLLATAYGVDSGSNDTYAITLSPALAGYVTGQRITFKANTKNTGAATLNVNGLGAKTIVKGINTTLQNGDISALQLVTVIYDGTNFVLQAPLLQTMGTATKLDTDGSTTQTIAHGLGRVPNKLRITVYNQFSTSNQPLPTPILGFGVYNGTNTYSVCSSYGGGNDQGLSPNASTTNIITLFWQSTGGGWGSSNVAVATMDETNITLTWTFSYNVQQSPGYTFILLWEVE